MSAAKKISGSILLVDRFDVMTMWGAFAKNRNGNVLVSVSLCPLVLE